MNKRLTKYGFFSLLIGLILLFIATPITMFILGRRSIAEVAVVALLYTYSGYAIAVIGLILIIVGLVKRSLD